MDRFREAELSQASELAAVLDEIKKTEARIKYGERNVLDLEQHISGVEFRTKELEAERKVTQDFNGKCQVRVPQASTVVVQGGPKNLFSLCRP